MNKAQFKQWWNHNLWFGEQPRRGINRVMVRPLIAPPTSQVWGVDISHWNIPPVDLPRMVTNYGMKFVIIKGADGSLKTKYHEQHIEAAKAANIPFGLYVWLYPNSKVSIDAQVGTWAALYNVYKPKLGISIDAEWTYYGGLPANPSASDLRLAHDKFRNVTGQRATTYTAAGYANTYLIGFDWSREPLWIANYGVTSPTLPKGATGYKFWQFTSTLDGKKLDPNGNAELDGNYYNGTQSQFDAEYGIAELPQNGGEMKGEVLQGYTINVRDGAGVIVTQLKSGDVVYGEVYTDNRERIRFERIYRVAGNVENLGKVCNAVTTDGANVRYIKLTNEAEPTPEPPPAPVVTRKVIVTVEEDGWKPVSVEVEQEKL